jgi:hypothetical protein
VPSGRHLGVPEPKKQHVIPNAVREVRNPSDLGFPECRTLSRVRVHSLVFFHY